MWNSSDLRPLPYDWAALEAAAEKIRDMDDVDVVVLDCIGFT